MQKGEVTWKSKKPNGQQFRKKEPYNLLLEEFRGSARPTLLSTKGLTLVSEDHLLKIHYPSAPPHCRLSTHLQTTCSHIQHWIHTPLTRRHSVLLQESPSQCLLLQHPLWDSRLLLQLWAPIRNLIKRNWRGGSGFKSQGSIPCIHLVAQTIM